MAKCVKRGYGETVEIRRVSKAEAAELVKQGWHYCPKSTWQRWLAERGESLEQKKEG